MGGVDDGNFGNGEGRVRDGVRGVGGLIGINGGRLVLHRNVIKNILMGIGGTVYTGVAHMTGILAKRG
jgi:hypothetical protein